VSLVRFKLNHNSNRLLPGERNFSVWVGDLTPEIDDLQLYRFFSARFKTIVSAKGRTITSTPTHTLNHLSPAHPYILIFIYKRILTAYVCNFFSRWLKTSSIFIFLFLS
jgi:hypothetical protein